MNVKRMDHLHSREPEIRVSTFERISGGLVAVNLLAAVAAALLFLVWLTSTVEHRRSQVPVTFVENLSGPEGRTRGLVPDMISPGTEELEEELELEVEYSLESLTNVVSSLAASLDLFHVEAVSRRQGRPAGEILGEGATGEGGDDVIPRWERWEVRYATGSREAYFRQLDHFGIELGAVGQTPQVDYARHLAAGSPETRSDSGDREDRLYLIWVGETRLSGWDRDLLRDAGIRTRGRIVAQFYPRQVEQQLAELEQTFAAENGREIPQVRRTVFGVRRRGLDFEYYVIEQHYRSVH